MVLDLLRYRVPGLMILVCLLTLWHTQLHHSVEFRLGFNMNFRPTPIKVEDRDSERLIVSVCVSHVDVPKDRDFLEVFAGHCAITNALRAEFWQSLVAIARGF